MMTNHPITPPPGLVEQLCNSPDNWRQQLTNAYQAGADQELKACCEWVRTTHHIDLDGHDALRLARRPKPPSLKEQALAVLDDWASCLDGAHKNTIRRALEALDD